MDIELELFGKFGIERNLKKGAEKGNLFLIWGVEKRCRPLGKGKIAVPTICVVVRTLPGIALEKKKSNANPYSLVEWRF